MSADIKSSEIVRYVPENIHIHPKGGRWKFRRGGGSQRPKSLKVKYEAKLEFPGGEIGNNLKW